MSEVRQKGIDGHTHTDKLRHNVMGKTTNKQTNKPKENKERNSYTDKTQRQKHKDNAAKTRHNRQL